MSNIKLIITNIYLQEQLLHASYHIALATTSNAKEIQLKHIVTALDYALQYKIKNENKTEYMDIDLFTHILITLDLIKPTDEDSIYAESNYPISKSIRAYLCVALVTWVRTYIEYLSVDESSLFLELIIPLLKDVYVEETKNHVICVSQIKELEYRVEDFIRKLFCFICSFVNFN